MHTSGELRSHQFEITVAGEPAGIETLFPGFSERDRLGVVIATDYGAAGASTLILAAVTAFYDRLRAAGEDFFAYPDFFAFHVGRRRGSLRKLDIYPAHKEIVVPDTPEQILRAINDRAITRLLVQTSRVASVGEPAMGEPASIYRAAPGPAHTSRAAPAGPEPAPETRFSAMLRIETALEYSVMGRMPAADVVVTGPALTESYVAAMLAGAKGDEARAAAAHIRSARTRLQQGKRPVESFRRLSLDQALRGLTGATGSAAPVPER